VNFVQSLLDLVDVLVGDLSPDSDSGDTLLLALGTLRDGLTGRNDLGALWVRSDILLLVLRQLNLELVQSTGGGDQTKERGRWVQRTRA
jgi:hypothetical protein